MMVQVTIQLNTASNVGSWCDSAQTISNAKERLKCRRISRRMKSSCNALVNAEIVAIQQKLQRMLHAVFVNMGL